MDGNWARHTEKFLGMENYVLTLNPLDLLVSLEKVLMSCGCQVFETDFVYRAAFSPSVLTVLLYTGNAGCPWNDEKPKARLIIIRAGDLSAFTDGSFLIFCVFLILLLYCIEVSTFSLSSNDSLKKVGQPEDFHDFHIVEASRHASSWEAGMESGDVNAKYRWKLTCQWIIQGKTHIKRGSTPLDKQGGDNQ